MERGSHREGIHLCTSWKPATFTLYWHGRGYFLPLTDMTAANYSVRKSSKTICSRSRIVEVIWASIHEWFISTTLVLSKSLKLSKPRGYVCFALLFPHVSSQSRGRQFIGFLMDHESPQQPPWTSWNDKFQNLCCLFALLLSNKLAVFLCRGPEKSPIHIYSGWILKNV